MKNFIEIPWVTTPRVSLIDGTKCHGVTFSSCVVYIKVGTEITQCTFDKCLIVGHTPFLESLKVENDFVECDY